MGMASSSKVDEAYSWLNTNQPELLKTLRDSDPIMGTVIDSATNLGPSKDAADTELTKAQFMLAASDAIFPIISIGIAEANRRRTTARRLTLWARIFSLFFSTATLTALSWRSIETAQWMAIGSVLSSLTTLFATHLKYLGDDKKSMTAEQALNKLIELDFDLRKSCFEITAHIKRGSSGRALNECINRANGLFRTVNTLRTELGIVGAMEILSSASTEEPPKS